MQKIQALKGANQGAAGLQPEAFRQALKGQPKLEALSSFLLTQILSVTSVVLSLAGRKELMALWGLGRRLGSC